MDTSLTGDTAIDDTSLTGDTATDLCKQSLVLGDAIIVPEWVIFPNGYLSVSFSCDLVNAIAAYVRLEDASGNPIGQNATLFTAEGWPTKMELELYFSSLPPELCKATALPVRLFGEIRSVAIPPAYPNTFILDGVEVPVEFEEGICP